jgi:hypothetical protein
VSSYKQNKLDNQEKMKVNWLKVCTVGLEVLLAVGTGIAVFAGISKATNTTSGNQNQAGNNNFNPPVNNNNNVVAGTENKLATGLRATQNSMEKIISVVGSLAVAAESIGLLFGKTVDRGYNQMPWYSGGYNNSWMTQTQPAYNGVGLRQVTPFVQEVGYYPSH